jgi:ABC-type multidrug transport system ATPase subunit
MPCFSPCQNSTHLDVRRSQIAFSGAPRTPLVQARTGYVMQDDALQPLLTVRETLMFSSQLRVPQDMGIEPAEDTRRREAKVDEIIRVLHLQRVADARIGSAENRGLSGGERRRVSIGEQLGMNTHLRAYSILFLFINCYTCLG